MKLEDKYNCETGRIYLTGIQALVRLPIDQMRRDRRAGLNTAAFISGYEGSPLGGYDLALSRAAGLLRSHQIHFVPGVNEDLAATSVFGSQIHHVIGEPKHDGVVGIWYGKGPGVDRSGDILRHGNMAGASANCGALLLAGDDHISKSSTIPHQSDLSFFNLAIPLFYPGNMQEILDYGLMAIALSRFSGAWVGMKMVTNVCDGGGTVTVDPGQPLIRIPEVYQPTTDPRLIPPYTLTLEHEVNGRRLEAAREFGRLNSVNTWFGSGPLGIATAGKTYYDVMQALVDLGIEREEIRIAKFGMTFPLDRQFVHECADGISTLLVIEEKRSFLELQLRDVLYGGAQRPTIIGKQDENGAPLLPVAGELDAEQISRVITRYTGRGQTRLKTLAEVEDRGLQKVAPRHANFCSGCPHNRSTLLLEGQVAAGGIGCHGMSIQLQDASRGIAFLTQMGGEGAPWIGMAPFVSRSHIFQNIGDGTYFHSGSKAIEACIAAGVNITFKILYNQTVAMTGGQEIAGVLPVPELARKLQAEGVRQVVVLTDEVNKYAGTGLTCPVRDRDDLPRVLRELEQIPGVTVIIYDQQCAAEKRRLRSRGKLEEPLTRIVINEEVCEGCGDCVRQSNCMSLYPVMTEYGEKTRIHQSSCNKDYSCLLGDCPSFVTVRLKPGTGLRKKPLPELPEAEVTEPPEKVAAGNGYAILMPGIGGTGVVTINALLATAAWMDGLWVTTLDQTGLAQKGGAVVSSIVVSEHPVERAAKISYANADLLLGFDLLGAAGTENLKRAHPSRTVAVVNTAEIPTGDFIRGARRQPANVADRINAYTRSGMNIFVDANRIAEGLFKTHLAANTFLLGVAYQAGLIPVSIESLQEAIRLNGVRVPTNLQAFHWGRKYYCDAQSVEHLLAPPEPPTKAASVVEHRASELEKYQDNSYSARYLGFVKEVEARQPELADIVARNLYKLMAYKDEYEVARLLISAEFEARIQQMWEAVDSVQYNLHPPILRALGWRKKIRLGPWFRLVLALLARLKPLRGTAFDPFGYAAIRGQERALISWYMVLVRDVLEHAGDDLQLAREIVSLPDDIRGYEEVKLAKIQEVRAAAAEKLAQLKSGRSVTPQA